MKNWVKKIVLLGVLAFAPLVSPLVAQAGPFGIKEGFLLRGHGDNLAAEPGAVKCKLFDEDGKIDGNIYSSPAVNGEAFHEINLKDGSKFKTIVSEDAIVLGMGPVNVNAFPELEDYAGNDDYQVWTFNTNSYNGINSEVLKQTGVFKNAKSVEVRCVYLVEMTAQGPVVLKCLKCHYFIGF